jgi:hypothetical protein
MNPSLRLTLALIAGVLTAFISIALIETLGHTIYPTTPGLDYSDKEVMRLYVESLPLGAKLFVLGAWLSGTVDGVFVACLINRSRYSLCAAVIGGMVLAATVANLAFIPHPLWLAAAGIVGIPLAAFLVTRLMPLILRQPEAAL